MNSFFHGSFVSKGGMHVGWKGEFVGTSWGI